MTITQITRGTAENEALIGSDEPGWTVLDVAVTGNVNLMPSWAVIKQNGRVGDDEASIRVAQAAGRRVVERYGPALDRLAE